MPKRQRSPGTGADVLSQPLVPISVIGASAARVHVVAPDCGGSDASPPVGSPAGAEVLSQPLVPISVIGASAARDHVVAPDRDGSDASPPVGSPAGAEVLPQPLVPVSVIGASAARDHVVAPDRGGSVASPPVGSPGRNKQLFMASVTPQSMNCNLSKLPAAIALNCFTPIQVLSCRVSA